MTGSLTSAQERALLFEQHSMRQLLAAGVNLIETSDHFEPIVHPLLTMWSIGVEKLYKIALGLAAVRDGRPWPSKREMQDHGHDIDGLEVRVMEVMTLWVREAPSAYRTGLLADVSNDRVWPSLRAALSDYGMSARFFYLDHLAMRSDGAFAAPHASWARVEASAISHAPAGGVLACTLGDEVANTAAAHARQAIAISGALKKVWHAVTRLAMHGALGPEGRRFGVDSCPQNAIPRVEV